MSKPFLYIFGFEDPIEHEVNESVGTDFESSRLILISAKTEAEALAWGREISERFVAHLYRDSTVSWKTSNFASWIDQTPERTLSIALGPIPEVTVGEYPDKDERDRVVDKANDSPDRHEG